MDHKVAELMSFSLRAAVQRMSVSIPHFLLPMGRPFDVDKKRKHFVIIDAKYESVSSRIS